MSSQSKFISSSSLYLLLLQAILLIKAQESSTSQDATSWVHTYVETESVRTTAVLPAGGLTTSKSSVGSTDPTKENMSTVVATGQETLEVTEDSSNLTSIPVPSGSTKITDPVTLIATVSKATDPESFTNPPTFPYNFNETDLIANGSSSATEVNEAFQASTVVHDTTRGTKSPDNSQVYDVTAKIVNYVFLSDQLLQKSNIANELKEIFKASFLASELHSISVNKIRNGSVIVVFTIELRSEIFYSDLNLAVALAQGIKQSGSTIQLDVKQLIINKVSDTTRTCCPNTINDLYLIFICLAEFFVTLAICSLVSYIVLACPCKSSTNREQAELSKIKARQMQQRIASGIYVEPKRTLPRERIGSGVYAEIDEAETDFDRDRRVYASLVPQSQAHESIYLFRDQPEKRERSSGVMNPRFGNAFIPEPDY